MNTDKYCIVIASHMSSSLRMNYLVECIESLLRQTLVLTIYLSISFETGEIRDQVMNAFMTKGFSVHPMIHIYYREQKTAQMRHVNLLMDDVCQKHDWIMFCDDDDTYEIGRVENLVKSITLVSDANKSTRLFAGLYESHCEKDHRVHRHEYWCYCVNKQILERFYNGLRDHPDIIDHKCCDVLFGEYMRRLGENYFFARLDMRLYNYRVTENRDSITGVIQSKQGLYTRTEQPPPIGHPEFSDYVLDWNDYLHEHLDVYLHDVFLRSLVGCDMNQILKSEFRADYEVMPFIDECHEKRMRGFHEYIRSVCSKLYDVPL